MSRSLKKNFGIALIAFLYVTGIGMGTVALLIYLRPVSLQDIGACIGDGYYGEASVDQACMQKTVSKLLQSTTTTALLAYIVAPTTPREIVNNCHAVAHVIGEETYNKAASLEDALAQCNADCSDGCVHGAIGAAVSAQLGEEYDDEDIAHASGKEIEKIGQKYCSQFSLCHAIGHVLYISFQDFQKSLQGCDDISSGVNREGCYEGVFMEAGSTNESLGPLLSGTTTLAKLKSGDYAYPCDSVPQSAQKACFLYLPKFQARAFNENGINSADEARLTALTCRTFNSQGRAYCFEGLGHSIFLSNTLNVQGLQKYCRQIGGEVVLDEAACNSGALVGYVDLKKYQPALQFCDSMNGVYSKSKCYDLLFQTFDERKLSVEVCDQARSSEECAQQLARYKSVRQALPDNYFDFYSFLTFLSPQ